MVDLPLHRTLSGTIVRSPYTRLQILLRCGVNPNQLNGSGQSPLIQLLENTSCHQYDSSELTKVFMDGGENPTQRNRAGDLPMYEVIRNTDPGEIRNSLARFYIDTFLGR